MKSFLFVSCLSLLLLSSCSKKINTHLPSSENAFVDSVFNYLNAHLPQEELQQLLPEQHFRLQRGDNNQLLIINYKAKNKFLIVNKTEEGFSPYINEIQWRANNRQAGTLHCTDINAGSESIVEFSAGRATSVQRYYNGRLHPFASVPQNSILDIEPFSIKPMAQEPVYSVLPEVTVTGGAGSSSYYYSSLYYMMNFSPGYYYSYTSGGGYIDRGNMGGGGGYSSPASQVDKIVDVPTHVPGTKPVDLKKELECFITINGATYMLRINVNQPEPNTREITNINADHMAGHTFLTLEQKNPDGSTTMRNIGWYPSGSAKPSDGTTGGQYQDDAGTEYSVSLSVSVSAAEFNNVKNYLGTVKNYNVQTANCTNIAINAFAKAGVTLPQTQGTLYGPSNYYSPNDKKPLLFKGVNPADLGQDIRGMNATTLSQQFKRTVIIEKTPSNNKTRNNSAKCR